MQVFYPSFPAQGFSAGEGEWRQRGRSLSLTTARKGIRHDKSWIRESKTTGVTPERRVSEATGIASRKIRADDSWIDRQSSSTRSSSLHSPPRSGCDDCGVLCDVSSDSSDCACETVELAVLGVELSCREEEAALSSALLLSSTGGSSLARCVVV